jgi:3,4-dihydroxy 2-butanone 4-phosphate synthase
MISLNSFGKTSIERVENAVKKLQQGFGILLIDDENRENEGDIIFSAEKMTEKDMALMIRECSGIVCLCLTEDKCNRLELRQMVNQNTSKNQTAFTISIEAKEGITTGVSAKDRLTTIKQQFRIKQNQRIYHIQDMYSHYWLEKMEFSTGEDTQKEVLI